MKTADIKVDQEYAWASYKGSVERQVKVLETGQPLRSWGSRQRLNNGVLVELLDDAGRDERFQKGAKVTVPSREITRDWAEAAAARDHKNAYEANRRENAAIGRAERLPTARRLVEILRPNFDRERITVHAPRGTYTDDEVIVNEIREAGLFELDDSTRYPVVYTHQPGVYFYWLTGSTISLPAEQILALVDNS